MNLSQLASFICTKVNQSETDDIAACKEFLKRRMEMIWNDELWKDSLVAFTQVLSPDDYAVTSTWLPTKGVLLCPTIIERVVAARLDSRKLNVQRQEFYYRFDYDSFAKNGSATEFVLLPPCVWEFETAQDLFLTLGEADAEKIVKCDALDADEISVERHNLSDLSELTTSRIDAMQKDATDEAAILALRGDITVTNNFNQPINVITTVDGVPTSHGALAVGGTLTISGRIDQISANYPVASPTDAVSDSPPDGQNFTGTISIQDDFTFAFTFIAGDALLTLSADSLAMSKRQRIRLLEIPEVETTIRVLGKRTMPTFTSDLDTPPISGVMNCLLAFAQSDMLQRERQYGKAQAIAQEGMGLLEQLKRQEVIQQAHNVSIQPSHGFVSEYQFNSGGYSPLTY